MLIIVVIILLVGVEKVLVALLVLVLTHYRVMYADDSRLTKHQKD